jgi:hypothetical protein
MQRIDVTFPSGSVNCAAWLGLIPHAEALAQAGAAVLVYDHRFIGDSEGESRQLIRPPSS